jgi:hypothetical protein
MMLAVHPITGIQYEALGDMLWAEAPDDVAAALGKKRFKLRTELHRLVPDLTVDPLPGSAHHGEKVCGWTPRLFRTTSTSSPSC